MRTRDIKPGGKYEMKDGSIKWVLSLKHTPHGLYLDSKGQYVNAKDIVPPKEQAPKKAVLEGHTMVHIGSCEQCGSKSIAYYSYGLKHFAKNALKEVRQFNVEAGKRDNKKLLQENIFKIIKTSCSFKVSQTGQCYFKESCRDSIEHCFRLKKIMSLVDSYNKLTP